MYVYVKRNIRLYLGALATVPLFMPAGTPAKIFCGFPWQPRTSSFPFASTPHHLPESRPNILLKSKATVQPSLLPISCFDIEEYFYYKIATELRPKTMLCL
jgi:hypothetical protein